LELISTVSPLTAAAAQITIAMPGRPLGPLGIDPLAFSASLFGLLFLFVVYLLLPRGVRVHYFGAYPKRYAWSARTRGRKKGDQVSFGHVP